LDSASGYFAALNFGETEGASVLFFGHLVTALVHGFPLGLLHVPISLGLAFQGWIMAKVSKKLGRLVSTGVGVAINTGLTATVIPVLGLVAAVAIAPFIFLASLVNGVAAYAVTQSLVRTGFLKSLEKEGPH